MYAASGGTSFKLCFFAIRLQQVCAQFSLFGATQIMPQSSQSRQPSTSQAAIKRDSRVRRGGVASGQVEESGRVLLGSASIAGDSGDSHIVSCNQGMSRAE